MNAWTREKLVISNSSSKQIFCLSIISNLENVCDAVIRWNETYKEILVKQLEAEV